LVAAAVFKLIPPVPDEIVVEVVPVVLPSVIALAKASVPKFNAPVPVCKVKAELSVVPRIDGPAVALPPSNHPENEPEVSKVPDTSGNVHVLAAVRSADVMVPVNVLVFTDDCGCIANLSELAVEEAKTDEPVVPKVVV
jgi:hypothetical protein